MLLHHLAGSGHRAAALVTHHDHERNAKMLDAILDRSHGRGVGHIAGVAGDE